jgi:hypothetical protein
MIDHQRTQEGCPMTIYAHCLIIMAVIFVQGSAFAEQAANPLLLSVAAEKTNILAGGKENVTDKTRVTIRLTGSSTASAINVDISLENGLGTQFSSSVTICDETIDIGGSHPARLIGNGVSVVAGQGSATYSLTPNIDHIFYLYSSNLVGDKARVKVKHGKTDKYSQTVNFCKPDYIFIYTDWNNEDVPEGGVILPFQLYRVRAELKFGGDAVVSHRVNLLCESVTDRSGDVHDLDANGNKSISQIEGENMNKILEISPMNSIVTGGDGIIRRECYLIKAPYVKIATLRVVDLSIYEVTQLP